LHFWTAANDAQNVRADTARGIDNDQQNLSEMIMWYQSVYNQTASAWRYSLYRHTFFTFSKAL